jgi:hypothetical protein
VSKAAILEAEGARAEAEEGLAALHEPLDAGEESAVEPGGGAARGTAPASRGTIETGAHRAAPERPPRANSADMDEVYEGAVTVREASGGALEAISQWRGMAGAALAENEAAAVPVVEARCLFDLLPFEMLSAVLAWLDWETLLKAAPAVCRVWRAVCRDLVPAVFEFPDGVRVGDGVLWAIGARFRKTRGVTIGLLFRCHHRATTGAVEELVMQCGQLRRLKLTSCELDVARLMPAMAALPHLHDLG